MIRSRPALPGARSAAQARRSVAMLLVAVAAGGCEFLDRLLDIEAPAQVPAGLLDNPEHANLLVSGAVADFECALGAYILVGGMIGNELMEATFTAARIPVDRRDVSPGDTPFFTNACDGNFPGPYRPLSTARWSAENALAKLEAWTDAQVANRTRLIATAAAYSGYSHLLLGEGFCSGVLLQADLTPGREASSQELFALAEQRFTRALEAAQATGDTETLNMARVGRARARLNQNKRAEAAADAALVPANFVKNAAAATTPSRRWNRIAADFRLGRASVRPEYRGLTVDGVPDPRVAVVDANRAGADATTRIWTASKYPADNTPIPIATWREAQLIRAEALGGQEAVDIINTLRARHSLPQFSSSDPNEIMAQVIEERQRELFLEGHHFFDLRRFNLPLTPAPGTAYPKGGVYGEMRCLPLPDVERVNNPNLGG